MFLLFQIYFRIIKVSIVLLGFVERRILSADWGGVLSATVLIKKMSV